MKWHEFGALENETVIVVALYQLIPFDSLVLTIHLYYSMGVNQLPHTDSLH